jgi:hypothetical protein
LSSFVGLVPIGVIIVAILFGSAVLAMIVAGFLPEHHLSPETKSIVSVSVAIVGTMSALVIGLLISTANSSFIAKSQEVTTISADTISLDRLLRRYGPQAQDIRALLQQYTAAELQDFFPEKSGYPANLENGATIAMLESLQDKVLALRPANGDQTWLQAQALTLTGAMMLGRWQLGQEDFIRSPLTLLVLVMFWFVVIFASFGLFAPRNATVIVAIFLSSLSIGGAIRMTAELQRPFDGVVWISSAPLIQALMIIER